MAEKEEIIIPTHIQQLVTVQQAWDYYILPKDERNGHLTLYIDETRHSFAIQNELELLFGKQVEFIKLPGESITRALGKYYRKSSKGKNIHKGAAIDFNDDHFLVRLIGEAHNIGCSDIHIEAFEEKCRIRMRIDGKLIERYIINKAEYPLFINKVKIKANLDISEKRLPQDGRIFYEDGQTKFDIRVSVLPSMYGEKVVLRLLSKDSTNIEISQLGFNEAQLDDYLEGVKRPHGIILISGPTGSGKTTTLYATLKILNKEETNILTIEDPIEYTLEGVTQVQLKEAIGLTFASALRTFLRQDPDVIMLGEIRDGETAQMAVRAALTGHLVLSTIHTNSAWGTVSRLVDMGVPSFLIANTLNLTVAQRLIRLLCPHCKEQKSFDMKRLPKNYKAKQEIHTHFVPFGCEECFYTGYRGRKAVYEVIPVDHELSEQIKANGHQVSGLMEGRGIRLLADTAMEEFLQGNTSIDEVYPILINTL